MYLIVAVFQRANFHGTTINCKNLEGYIFKKSKFMKFIHQAQSKLAIVYTRDACKGYLLCSDMVIWMYSLAA